MKRLVLFIGMLAWFSVGHLGAQAPFQITIEAENFSNFPGLQSFAIAEYDGKWIILAGRKDGLHRRQPFAAFAPAGANSTLYVADITDKTLVSVDLSSLPVSLQEQLSATNLLFVQRDEVLYLAGGYGFSTTQNSFVTYPYLTAVDLPTLLAAVAAQQPITAAFTFIEDERFRVTGGYMHQLNDEFFLVGGQNFRGRYNPMGPNHGPGFFQAYTNAIKRFAINHTDEGNLVVTNYQETIDSLNLHRRDYNLVHQIFPDGSRGFTAFSGVFRYDADLPWLNTVDIKPEGYTVNNAFQQYLNQYHTASTGLYDATTNKMYSLFLGGISQYFIDEEGALTEDVNVPFVRTISLVERNAAGQMTEYKVGDMPALLGSSAEFVLAANVPADEYGLIQLDQLPAGRQLLGYVVGGIESTQPNILFQDNNGSMSMASGRVWRVYLEPAVPTYTQAVAESYFAALVSPNPNDGRFTLSFLLPADDEVALSLTNVQGQVIDEARWTLTPGSYEWAPESTLSPGTYYLRLQGRRFGVTRQVVVP